MKHEDTDTNLGTAVLDSGPREHATHHSPSRTAPTTTRNELALLDAADRLFDAQRHKDAATWLDHAKQSSGE